MSGPPPFSATTGVWGRAPGAPTSGPVPIGGPSTALPTVNNPNLPVSACAELSNVHRALLFADAPNTFSQHSTDGPADQRGLESVRYGQPVAVC